MKLITKLFDKLLYLPYMLFSLSIILVSCNDNNDQVGNKIYITQAKFSNYAGLTLYSGTGSLEVSASASYKVDNDTELRLQVMDQNFIDEYNQKHKTEYELVPSSAISISENNLKINKNFAFSDNSTITVTKWDDYTQGVDYAIPLKITPHKGGLSTIEGSDVLIIELSENIVSNAAYAPSSYGPRFFPINSETIFGPDLEGKPYGQITVEGKFMFTKYFSVPGNWRADVFDGFGLQILTNPDATMNVRMGDASFIGTFGNLSLNRWHHFAVTVDNGAISCYVDGDLKLTTSYTGSMTAGNFSIGGWANYCGLAVDEFRIWKTVRTAKQIKKYPCAVDPNHPDLLVYYKFNETSGQIAKDATPRGHDLSTTTDIQWLTDVPCP